MHDLHVKGFLKWVGLPVGLILVVGYFLTSGYYLNLHWIFLIHAACAVAVYGPMVYFTKPVVEQEVKEPE
tara:strand:- start:866 stop:1075 length:210 start_codon:yes stop_codon:yes gene_type:complete